MSLPRDHHVADRTGRVRAARLFSNAVSPPTMFAVLGLLFALVSLPLFPALAWAALYGFLVSLAPILFIFWLLRTGRIKELHMTNRGERHWPYAVAAACAALFLVVARAFGAPELLVCLSIFNVIELSLLGLINAVWLISIHTTGAAALALLVGYVFGLPAALLTLPLVALVVYVRLYLKRHTPAQLLAGMGLGLFSVWILTFFGCFV